MHLEKHLIEWDYKMNDRQLETVKEEKNFGMIRYNIKLSGHFSQAYFKANRMLRVINRTIERKNRDFNAQSLLITCTTVD